VSRPLLSNSPTVQLAVGTDRKLRATALVASDLQNALEVKPDGLWSGTVNKTGVQVKQVASNPQTFPVYSNVATPSASEVIYNSADIDRDGLWSSSDPNKITFKRTGWYLVASTGKWQTVGTFAQYGSAAWIARNGDENLAVDVWCPWAESTVQSNTIGTGSGELTAGAWHCLNLAHFEAGEWITTKVVFQAVSAGAITMTMSTNIFNGGCVNCGAQTVCQMTAALVRDG
jgi:hypothetical protein